MKPTDFIAIGTSAGGWEALQVLLSNLPESTTVPIAIVMHLPEHADIHYSNLLKAGHYQVVEARDKMKIELNTIVFAPPGYHLLIEKDFSYCLTQEDQVHFSRPSIDVLFESAASVFKSRMTGILLTGANEDGAQGLLEIHSAGGQTIIQHPNTARSSAMPEAGLRVMIPDAVWSLPEIRNFLTSNEKKEVPWKI